MTAPSGTRRRPRWRAVAAIAIAASVVLLVGAAWWYAYARRPAAGQRDVASSPPPAGSTDAGARGAPGTTSTARALPGVGGEAVAHAAAPDGDQGGPGDPRHPMTPERRRLQREVRLVAALDDAVDRGDADRVDALVATHRHNFPDDAQHLRGGYSAIAACLGRPGPDSRAAAQAYYDAYRASPLRRQVRRHCFEP